MSAPIDRAAETHRRIVQTASHVFGRYGFRQANVDLVAEEAGLSRAGLYKHFANKEQLFAACVEQVQMVSVAASECAGQDARAKGGDTVSVLTAKLSARVGVFAEALRGSPHMAELMDEQNRQCGAIVTKHKEHFRMTLITWLDQERQSKRIALPKSVSSADVIDDATSIAIGIKSTVPASSPEAMSKRLERILRRMVDGIKT